MAKVQVVTLGADPEFELVVGGRIVSASSVLREDIRLPWGDIGVDGAGWPLELRPVPGKTARELVQNVGRLIVAVPKAVGGVPSSICEAYAIGGHVHVGFKSDPGLAYRDIVKTIDDALGDIFYSLNTRTRISAGYGKRKDWREQYWGVEYRTPPSAVWSHPGVALTFVGAIKWAVQELLRGENPLRSPALTKVRAAAKKAAAFVKRHGGRLHWGAWKAFAGEVDISRHLGVKIRFDSGDRDSKFFADMEAMLARLGIASIRITSLHRSRGDFASNVPGYGTLVNDFTPFTPGGALCLSWRFRTDPDFRRKELPKLEAAIAAILRNSDDGDGGRLVKEVVPLKVVGPPEEPEPEPMDAPHSYDDEDCVRCEECGEEIHVDDTYEDDDGNIYCEQCYYDIHTACERCGREVHRDDTYITDSGYGPYCTDCYYELYDRCTHCDREVATEYVHRSQDGDAYCERCYTRLFVICDHCEGEVRREEAIERCNGFYCEDCFGELFTQCEHCLEYYLDDDVDYVNVREGGGRTRRTALCQFCREDYYQYDEEDDVWVEVG
jgi:hypothetical protein